jgi:peptidoglycan/LPS O-acetylase OafA/YrhL
VVRERLDILDGLRGLAILLVVWYHVYLVSGQDFGPLTFIAQAGFLGVDLFFFISGFCLFYPYARALAAGKPLPSTQRFFERRVLKIVPSYLLALFVFTAVSHAQFASFGDAVLQVLSHLAFLHTLNAATYGTISGPLWTLGVEVQFYLLFPLIVTWFRRAPVFGFLILAGVSEAYRLGVDQAGLGAQFLWINQLPAFFDVFGAGMLAAYALVALRARGSIHAQTASAAAGVFLALAIAGCAIASWTSATQSVDDAHIWLNAHRFLIGPLCFALAISTFFATRRWQAFVASPALVFLSAISYNLYLWHLEIAVWIHAAGFSAFWTVVLAIPAAISVAAIITYRLEAPILALTFSEIRTRLGTRFTRPAAAEVVLDHAA